jgi:hypothetical protein
MNQCQIAVEILPSLGFCQAMVNLNLFLIEEGFPTFQTSSLLPLGELLFRERQVFGFCLLAFRPVVFEMWIIG